MLTTAVAFSPALGADGIVTKPSAFPVAETIERLEKSARERDFVIVARIDHAAAATKAGLELRPTVLLIFGNPRGGTPLMQSAPSIGLDLPLKALAWEDAAGRTWLAYNDPQWLAQRHGLTGRPELVQRMSTALDQLTDAATKR
ncbi:MAG: DUF302 domain-containing protein [Candidatus Rokuibacteriota bacterium]